VPNSTLGRSYSEDTVNHGRWTRRDDLGVVKPSMQTEGQKFLKNLAITLTAEPIGIGHTVRDDWRDRRFFAFSRSAIRNDDSPNG
jgi:hypothetical protein